MTSRTMYRIRAIGAGAAVLVALAIPAAASAGPLVADAPDCAAQSLGQPFLPWADVAQYTLDPGGSFEPGSPAWSLDGASVVAGNESFDVTGDNDRRSLSLPAGSSAVSRPLCVGIEHPDIRFFSRSGNVLNRLNVEVLFEDGFGNVQAAPIGAVTSDNRWAPSAPLPIVVNLLPLLPGARTAVAFRFTAASGSVQIDDVYVDPFARR